MFQMWIVVALPFDEKAFLDLAKDKKYILAPAAGDKQFVLTTEGAKSSIFACTIDGDALNGKDVYDSISSILYEHHFEYYGLVISDFSNNSIWDAGNIINDKSLSFALLKDNKHNIN